MPAPHSWGFSNWPWWVWPGDGVKGKRFVRTYEDALFKVGALTRGGRELIVNGEGFTKFLHSQRHRVQNFEVPCNRPEHLAARDNGKGVGS